MRNPLISFLAITGFFLYGMTPNHHDQAAPNRHNLADPNHHDPFSSVHTSAGLISGATSADGAVHIFKGIPFAAPPIGPNRWRAPQPLTPWKGVRKCDSFGPSPMQPAPKPFGAYTSEFLIPEKPISEDCLYLNVWTAATTPKEKRPVLVYIYGGGFVSGGSACPIYDGTAIARKGVVFVTINYRVGIFGFFAHPGLTAESGHHASGNYGLMDQIAALQWVKGNIAAFGGDPSNMTIAGQSAGSMSVSCLVASPLAKGLFKRAIGESGASILTTPYIKTPTLQQAEQEGLKVASKLNLTDTTDLPALRAIPADRLLQVNTQYSPIVDGYVLPESPGALFRQHRYNVCDLLTGWTEDDWFLFSGPLTAIQFRAELAKQFGPKADSAQIFYPATDDATALNSLKHYTRDVLMAIQNYTWANLQSDGSGDPGIGAGPGMEGYPSGAVYVYRFRRRPPATGDFVQYGAFHTAEVPYAYDNLAFVNRPWEPVDHQLAETMSSYWANFARTGDPNNPGKPNNSGDPGGPGLPVWPRYDHNPAMSVMILDEHPHSAPLPDKAALDFILRNSISPMQP